MSTIRYLDERRELRHHDGDRDAEQRAVIGDAKRMIARGRRDHAALALRFRKLQKRVARAAFLEAARALQVIELAVDMRAGQLRERNRLDAWRFVNAVADALVRRCDIGD